MISQPQSLMLVFDTTEYSGNFECELCAYVTSIIGDCGVGKKQAQDCIEDSPIFYQDWWNDHILYEADEHGCERQCSTYETPGIFNNGWGFYFIDGQEKLALQKLKESAIEYCQRQITQAENNSNWNQESKELSIKHNKEEIEKYSTLTVVSKYPVAQSIAIFIDEKLPKEILELAQQKADEFSKNYITPYGTPKPFKITDTYYIQPKFSYTTERQEL